MTRRDWLALSTALISAACNRRRGSGYYGYALIATSGDNSLAVVDLADFRLLKSIPLGAAPTAVVPSHTVGGSYVLTPSSESVHIVDGNLRLAVSRRLGGQLSQIRLMPDGGPLLAIGDRELIYADPQSLRVKARLKLRVPAVDIDVSQAGYIAVCGGPSGTVELFPANGGRRTTIQLSGALGSLRFRLDSQLLLVANLQDRVIVALDVPSLQVVAELPVAMRPDNLCFNFDRGQLFVSGAGMDGVAIVFPYKTLEVDQTVLAGRSPGVMACSTVPQYLFVGSATAPDLCILNVDNRKMIGLVDLGGRPTYITITPDSQYALVLNETAGDMAVIHIPAIPATVRGDTRETGGAALFTVLNVGSNPVHAAVVPRLV
jgi:hypothetical protein